MRWILILSTLFIWQCKPAQEKAEVAASKKEEQLVVEKNIEPMKKISKEELDYLMGKFDPKSDERFVVIPTKYADRAGLYMRKEAYESFIKMHDAAAAEGIDMQIRSATRNFDYQKGIWERKYTGQTKLSDGTNVATDIAQPIDKCLKILEYSSMPSTSRHHWGTDIDINAFNNDYFKSGKGKKLYDWMVEHASKYGYCQPYTPYGKGRPYGYNEEKWHWSYMPISQKLTQQAKQHLKDEMIEGFSGAESAPEIGVVEKYVLGINPACK